MLLSVQNLKTHFRVGHKNIAKAVDGVSFQIQEGKTLALVGESGCGKSQTAFSIIRLIAENGFHPSGKIIFDKKDLSSFSELEMQEVRGDDIAMIFQEPMTSLNPLYRIGNQLQEPLRLHRKMQKGPARKKAIELLDRVGIPDPDKRIDDFPHQLSGGMKQRVMIAMALACEPKLLIADEPTTALDVTIQAQVLRLISDLQQQTGMAILLITHDMGIVNQMADDLAIMYAGKIVEQGSRDQIFSKMLHPYTHRLFDSIPKPEDTGYLLKTIPGLVPPATDYGSGCLFADRCEFSMDHCHNQDSPVYSRDKGHDVRCHLYKDSEFPDLEQNNNKLSAPQKTISSENLLTVKELKTWFPVHKGVFRRVVGHVKAVDGIDMEVKTGSTIALVGESGCGKTTLGESLLRLNKETKGIVTFKNQNLLDLPSDEIKKIRKHLQIVFQDPFGSLSPRMRVQEIIGEGLEVHIPKISDQEKSQKVSLVLQEVGLDPSVANRYPHEFSGGQRQRISIARALILEPEFLVLDEPTSALDVSVQAQVLNLLQQIQSKRKLTYMFITHNLSVVRYLADKVAIMYLGRVVEYAEAKDLFSKPLHPYTQSLIEAIPSLGDRTPFKSITGDVPSPLNPPQGCHFHPRCPIFQNESKGSNLQKKCLNEYPGKTYKGEGFVACHAEQ